VAAQPDRGEHDEPGRTDRPIAVQDRRVVHDVRHLGRVADDLQPGAAGDVLKRERHDTVLIAEQ
jgi:hypothetical protein